MNIEITDNHSQMEEIGRQIYIEKKDVYNERIMDALVSRIRQIMPNEAKAERESFFYRSIYDYWVYGSDIYEEIHYHFADKTDEEKRKYITERKKLVYLEQLNKEEDVHYLRNKYEAYEKLKGFFGRDLIRISDEDDFGIFSDFVDKHKEFIVKPNNLSQARGTHWDCVKDGEDKRAVFQRLLLEGKRNVENYAWSNDSSLVLEELIVQSEALSRIHPASVNGVRCTTVRVNDKVHIFGPWLKFGVGGQFIVGEGMTCEGLLAGINPETGIVETPGYNFDGECYEKHPYTDVMIPGYVIPRWDEMIETVTKLSDTLPMLKYVGWDMTLTDKGWIVIEGNDSGRVCAQLAYQRGMKDDFEKLLGWKLEDKFWWE